MKKSHFLGSKWLKMDKKSIFETPKIVDKKTPLIPWGGGATKILKPIELPLGHSTYW
jgi:hypothetical protein